MYAAVKILGIVALKSSVERTICYEILFFWRLDCRMLPDSFSNHFRERAETTLNYGCLKLIPASVMDRIFFMPKRHALRHFVRDLMYVCLQKYFLCREGPRTLTISKLIGKTPPVY